MKILLVIAVALLAACTARRSEPLRGSLALTTDAQKRGQQAYFRHCHNCHPGGEAGLGPALNDKPSPPVALKAQVRLGVGAMPAIPVERLSSADLDALVDYMLAVRNHGPLLVTE